MLRSISTRAVRGNHQALHDQEAAVELCVCRGVRGDEVTDRAAAACTDRGALPDQA